MSRKTLTENENGATAVEFAIILPLLILVVFGIIEFGLLLFNQHVITTASREGARAGIVFRDNRFQAGDLVNVEDIVDNWAENHLVTFGDADSADTLVEFIDVDDDGDPNCKDSGCRLKVTITYEYDFLVLSVLGFGPRTLTATSLMRLE